MFDFSRITEAFGDLTGGSPFGDVLQNAAGASDVTGLIESVGIDPASLAGLDQTQILDILTTNGIDVSALTGGQLEELMASVGQDGLAGQALEFLAGGNQNA